MPLVIFAQVVGWLFARLPEACAKFVCAIMGDLIYLKSGRRSRRRAGLVNLSYAFPDKPEEWRRAVCRESCRRLIELGMLVLVTPHCSPERLKTMFKVTQPMRDKIAGNYADHTGGVAFVPHFTHFESLNILPLFIPEAKGFGAIYRPFKNLHFDAWIRKTRTRFGMVLLSRKEGFAEAMNIVRGGGWVGILFDQNAGHSGTLITLFDRTASATDLPGLICRKFKAPGVLVWSERTAFWRCEMRHEVIPASENATDYTLASNRWMERYLSSSFDHASDWMWTHRRWGYGKNVDNRFNLKVKKDLRHVFSPDGAIPRGIRYWVWLPADPSHAEEFKPLLARLREVRPDCAFTLMGSKAVLETYRGSPLAEGFIELPESSSPKYFQDLALRYPDTVFVLDPSPEAARLANLTEADFVLGLTFNGAKKTTGLTHAHQHPGPEPTDAAGRMAVWTAYFEQWGLAKDS